MSWVLLLVAAGILFFFLKYFAQESPQTSDSARAWVDRNLEHVTVMFPAADVSAVAYDLSKTRNVERTIEKLLSGRPLTPCPRDSVYFRAPTATSPASSSTSTSTPQARKEAAQKTHPDLIERFGLAGRSAASQPETYTWSKERSEREATLRKRKEDAILRARQKLDASTH